MLIMIVYFTDAVFLLQQYRLSIKCDISVTLRKIDQDKQKQIPKQKELLAGQLPMIKVKKCSLY